MARSLWDEVTFIVKDKKDIIRSERVKSVDARNERRNLEKNYPFPQYEILELITEEPFVRRKAPADEDWTANSKAKVQNTAQQSLQLDQDSGGQETQLLVQLEQAVVTQNIESIRDAASKLQEQYGSQESVRKKVGLAYASHGETREQGIEILESVVQNNPNIETYMVLAEAYASAQKWAESAQNYFAAGELDVHGKDKIDKWLAAAYMFWFNKQYEQAVEVTQRTLALAEEIGEQKLIQSSRHALAYYWAEMGQNLETALKWCLEILDIDNDENFVHTIEERAFTEQKEGQIIDTVGRVAEALNKSPVEVFRLYKEAKRIDPHPITEQNLARAYKLLGSEIESTS